MVERVGPKQGKLVAASTGSVADASGTQYLAVDSSSHVIRAGAKLALASYTTWSAMTARTIKFADIFQDNPMLVSAPLKSFSDSGHGLDWVALTVVP